MPEENRNDNRNGKKGTEFKVPPRTYILWIAILGAIPLLMFFKNTATPTGDVISQTEFESLVDSNLVTKGTIIISPSSNLTLPLADVSGKYLRNDGDGRQVASGTRRWARPRVGPLARLEPSRH